MLNKYTLFISQLVAHIALVYLIFYGDVYHWTVCLVVYFFNGCIGMSVTYHRGLSHRSWAMPKIFEWFGVLCATIGMTGSAISWVAIHRKHHRFTDTERDPHSPSFKGFFFCQWLSMFIPVEVKYVPDLFRNSFYKLQHNYYFVIGLTYGLILYLIDPFLVIAGWLAPAAILWNGGSFIVTLAHLWGGKSSMTKKDQSRNNWFLALLIWGEGWHDNHHRLPESPRFSKHWWQWDPGYYVIFLVELISKTSRNFKYNARRT